MTFHSSDLRIGVEMRLKWHKCLFNIIKLKEEQAQVKDLAYQPKASELEQTLHCYQCHGPY